MKTWILLILILGVLAGLAVFEGYTVNGFCSDITPVLEELSFKKTTIAPSDPGLSVLKNAWQSNREWLFVFFNHSLVCEFDECMSQIERFSVTNDSDTISHTISKLSNANERLKNTHAFKIANIF